MPSPFFQEVVRRGHDLPTAVRQLYALLDQYGPEELAPAVDEALARGTSTPSAVALLIDQERRRQNVPPKVPFELPEKLRSLRVSPHKLESYDPHNIEEDDDDE